MAERTKPHLGRTLDGDREKPVESFEYDGVDPVGTVGVADSVALDGARADVGVNATRHADEVQKLIDKNRDCVDRFRSPDAGPTGQK
jgi:hypothetical protein